MFTNYCILFIGSYDLSKVKLDVQHISESNIKFLRLEKSVFITFTSIMSVFEIEDFFRTCGREFILFEIDQYSIGYNFLNDNIPSNLFSDLGEKPSEEEINDFFTPFDYKMGGVKIEKEKKKLTEEDVKILTFKEKEEIQDKILDKYLDNGIKSFTQDDMDILNMLWS